MKKNLFFSMRVFFCMSVIFLVNISIVVDFFYGRLKASEIFFMLDILVCENVLDVFHGDRFFHAYFS